MFREWEWHENRWQILLERRQNMEPPKKTKNGHCSTVPRLLPNIDVLFLLYFVSADDICFKSTSFVVPYKCCGCEFFIMWKLKLKTIVMIG
ncbi:hypothetical protein TorRG33x02_288050 [Trema orientale]|uniref:Uncharacterized protein n=1 Tax=Trema orientale TaxID=63057 RepID=A0A2P5CEJ5_TREOI|nr:hypothetical protein TorRG33x02_288050 [Trema orientale]